MVNSLPLTRHSLRSCPRAVAIAVADRHSRYGDGALWGVGDPLPQGEREPSKLLASLPETITFPPKGMLNNILPE